MLKIEKNVLLAPYTTLKIGLAAEFFAVIKSRTELLEAIGWAKSHKKTLWILGGGSNVLISKMVKGLVLKNEIKGMEVLERADDYALVEAKSGENWTKFVNFTVKEKLYGLENLFLIYGTVGAAPVQNIGAYGVELKDHFYHLKAIDLKTGHEKIFSKKDCRFAYRDSVFKNRLKGKYFIYSVVVKLSRKPELKLDYGSIRSELDRRGVAKPGLQDVIRVIGEIRTNKLPNPGVLPNVGSFFKNPEISTTRFKALQKKYPELPNWPLPKGGFKVSAAWLIEAAGFKGKQVDQVSMYEKQALILVNHGGADAKAVLALIKKLKAAIKKKFGLDLEEEVNII
ncbi:MAG: UDP-N-acetylmuramate dehydrogenase [Patescibacteria group bacterium]